LYKGLKNLAFSANIVKLVLYLFFRLIKEVNAEQAKKLDTVLGFGEPSGDLSGSVRGLSKGDNKEEAQ
jgi:hypothetical protein